MSKYEAVKTQLDAIEAELKKLGIWQSEPLPTEAFAFTKAFAMDTMAYSQWLQFVFIPRVRGVIEQQGAFPTSSAVGVQAVREFDAVPNASGLTRLLGDFDALISRS